MLKQMVKAACALILSLLVLSACQGKPEQAGPAVVKKVEPAPDNAARQAPPAPAGAKIEVEVRATANGKPAAGARVAAGGVALGTTDDKGYLLGTAVRTPGEEVELVVTQEVPGFSVTPWKAKFVVKLPKGAQPDRYSFEAELKVLRYVTFLATEDGSPVEGAAVTVNGKKVGETDADGEFAYEFAAVPKKGFEFGVSVTGLAPWTQTAKKVESGEVFEVALSKRSVVTVSCLTDEYGRSRGVAGVALSVDGKTVGKTDAKGVLTYVDKGKPGRKARLSLSAPGYIPAVWETRAALQGEVKIQRFFHPATPRPIRTGVYGFVGNTPGVDLTDAARKAADAVASELFRSSAFRQVPAATLQAAMKKAKLSVEKATTRGWQSTALAGDVDVIVLGSVAKDETGYLIETKLYGASGKQILSVIGRAREGADLAAPAKEIVAGVIERFPFEGTVVSVEEDRYRVNLGKSGYRIARGAEFDLFAPVAEKSGKVKGHRASGVLRVQKADDKGSWAVAEDLKEGAKISVGDRVVRYVPREGEGAENAFVVSAKGGVPPDVAPLSGVNVYLNGEWIGSTGTDGQASVPVRLGKNYNLLLYRHGYRAVNVRIRANVAKETKEFVLSVNNALFKVESEPPGADVSVDGTSIGKTPLAAGKVVPLGFHSVRVSAGGDYRDFEEVIDFSRDVEDRTGGRKIVLFKDYLAIGERARKAGNLDGAIQAFAAAAKDHPDYSEAHGRLAMIYLDDRNDYGAAIREFENVLSLPQNRQLVYKQFAVMFANLGHACYEKGSQLANRDRDAAAQNLAKAIQNLQTARQNMRFFPAREYEEAVHDTYYYTALSHHKLYLMTKKASYRDAANTAWQDYFDFFPEKLSGNAGFEKSREAAKTYWAQIREKK
jgi:hypothetical protein